MRSLILVVLVAAGLTACSDPVAPYTPGKAAWPANYHPHSPIAQPQEPQ